MSDLTDRFFSPLGKEWCIYYFAILVFVFIFFVLSIISAVIGLFNLKKFGFNEIYLLCQATQMGLWVINREFLIKNITFDVDNSLGEEYDFCLQIISQHKFIKFLNRLLKDQKEFVR